MKTCTFNIVCVALLLIATLFAPLHSTNAAPPSYFQVLPLPSYNVTPSGFTVECWVKIGSGSGFDPRIIRCVGPGPEQPCGFPPALWDLSICSNSCGPGRVFFGIQDNGGTCHELVGNTCVANGIYHHIAATYDGAQMKLYVDGNLDTMVLAGGILANVAGGNLVVGNSTQINNAFDGQIDELRLWKVARTQPDIQAGMGIEIGLDPNLVAYWRFNGDGTDLVAGNNLAPNGDIVFIPGKLNQAVDISNPGAQQGCVTCPPACPPNGDINRDGSLSPADVVLLLNCTFLGTPGCLCTAP